MLHAGVDMHKRFSVVTVVDDEGKELVAGEKLPNENEQIITFFKGLGGEVRAVLEASPNWQWMCDLLDDNGIENILCHPLKTKAIAEARIKDGQARFPYSLPAAQGRLHSPGLKAGPEGKGVEGASALSGFLGQAEDEGEKRHTCPAREGEHR